MLKIMRDNLKSLSWILAFVVIAFIFAIFAEYGGQGEFVGGTDTRWAAQVNGEEIGIPQFLNAARTVDSYYRTLLGSSYNPAQLNLNIGQQAINQLVQEEVILDHAAALGLTATAAEIREFIVKDPNLQGENGAFIGVDSYKALLQRNNVNPAEYERDISRQVVRRKWMDMMTADLVVTEAEVEEEIRRRDETADVILAHFHAADFEPKVELDDAAVTAWYAANEARYSRGEGRVFELVVFDRLREQAAVKVTDAELRAAYDAALASRFTVPEQRRASHILIRTQETFTEDQYAEARGRAEAARQRILAGEDFATVADATTEDTTAGPGGDSAFFGKGDMTLAFDRAAFALAKGGISEVVQTPYGFHVIKITEIMEPRMRPLEEVRDELKREVSFRKAGELVETKAAEFQAALAGRPESFADEAARRTLLPSTTRPIHEGDAIPDVGAHPEVQRALFALEEGQVTEAIAVPRGYVVARLLRKTAGGAPPLTEIRQRVEADYRAERATHLAREAATRAMADPSADLRTVAEAMGVQAEESLNINRGLALGDLGSRPELDEVIFSVPLDTLSGPHDVDGDGVVLQVTARNLLTDEELDSRRPAVRAQIIETQKLRLLNSVIQELAAAADVVYNAELIAQYGPAAPQAPPVANPASIPSS